MPEWTKGDPANAPRRGALARGGSLAPARLLAAYRAGIFPWCLSGQSLEWWCPDPRFVMTPADFRLTDSLRKTLRKKGWQVTCDQAFEIVMRSCAAVQREGQTSTWITEPMIAAYTELNRLGIAHSIEVRWEGELVGGLYGIAIGRLFHGESMFHTRTDASKVAFAHLVQRLSSSGYVLIDCQLSTPHLASLGAFHISRDDFLAIVHRERDLVPPGNAWTNPSSAGS